MLEREEETLIIILLNLKDTIIPVCFVALLSSPILQIALPLCYCLSMSYITWRKSPFRKGSGLNAGVTFNEGTLAVIMAVFLLLHILDGRMSQTQKYRYFGWTIIALLLALVFFNIVLGAFETYCGIRDFLRLRCQRTQSENQE